MINERKISLCIPTYNRFELLINSFVSVLSDERIDEIIISDDASNLEIYDKVHDFVSGIKKIKLYRNAENQDCYKNKYTSLTYAKNDFCILFDSDNEITSDYINKIFDVINWNNYSAMLPSWAMPHFDYRKYEGYEITKENAFSYMDDSTFRTMLNTANYFVNKDFYVQCWDGSIDPNNADSIFMSSQMLKNGGKLYVVPGLHYEHRVDDHKGEQPGHFVSNQHKNMHLHGEIEDKIRALR